MFIIYGCLFNSLFLVCFFHVESIFYLALNTIFHFKRGVIKVYLLYWILSFNYFSIILFLIIGLAVVIFYNSLVDIKLTILCWLMVLVLLLVNSCVIHFSINYLSIIEFSTLEWLFFILFLGYECYLSFDSYIFIGSNSDCLDRYLLRFNEIIDSCRIIYGIIFLCCSYYYLFNYYSICSFSIMEWLIYTFLISFPFILSRIGFEWVDYH